jgi:hypothetical protein
MRMAALLGAWGEGDGAGYEIVRPLPAAVIDARAALPAAEDDLIIGGPPLLLHILGY